MKTGSAQLPLHGGKAPHILKDAAERSKVGERDWLEAIQRLNRLVQKEAGDQEAG